MSAAGERIEQERQVICTLIHREYAYKELPDGFSSRHFESVDYRRVYELLEREYISAGLAISEAGVIGSHPELIELIENISFPLTLLGGELRGRAIALRHKRVLPPESLQIAAPKSTDKQFQFELLNGSEIVSMVIPPESHLIRGLIPDTGLTFLFGEEGCGKSILAMNLALSVAVGASRWLSYEVVKHGRVLYLNNEMAFTDFARRLKDMASSLPAKGEIANLILPKEVPPLTQCWNALNDLCSREQPCLVILDCLYFAHDKDENDSSSMKSIMRQLIAVRNRFNLALLLVHHSKKGSRYGRMHNDQMRGSSVFSGASDTVLQIRRSAASETRRIIKPTKFRHVSDENRTCRLLSLNPETLWFKDEGETDEREHIARLEPTMRSQLDFSEIIRPGEELSRKAVVERCAGLGLDDRTIDRALQLAKSTNQLKSPKYGHYALCQT